MTNVEVREVNIGYLLRDQEAWWDICWNSGFRGPLAQPNPTDLQQFKEEHLREVAALRGRDASFLMEQRSLPKDKSTNSLPELQVSSSTHTGREGLYGHPTNAHLLCDV